MYLLRLLLLSPLLGLGILVRTAPYFVLFGWTLWHLLQRETLIAITDALNEMLGSAGPVSQTLVLAAMCALLTFLLVLAMYRCALEAAVQRDLLRHRPAWGWVFPQLTHFGASMNAWLTPIAISALIFLWPYLGEDFDAGILAEPLINRSDPGAPRIDAPLNMLGAILFLCWIYFPLFGVRSIRTAAVLSGPSAILHGFVSLLILVPVFLTANWFVALWILQGMQKPLQVLVGQPVEITRGVIMLTVFAATWCALSAASAQIFKRSLTKSLIRQSKLPLPAHRVEEILGESLNHMREIRHRQ